MSSVVSAPRIALSRFGYPGLDDAPLPPNAEIVTPPAGFEPDAAGLDRPALRPPGLLADPRQRRADEHPSRSVAQETQLRRPSVAVAHDLRLHRDWRGRLRQCGRRESGKPGDQAGDQQPHRAASSAPIWVRMKA